MPNPTTHKPTTDSYGAIEDLHYSIEEFSDRGSLIEVLGRIHDLDAARAAYEVCVKNAPGKIIMLRQKAQVLRRSDRVE